MSSPVTPPRPTNNTTCPGAPHRKQRPANLDLSNCHFGLAPRRLDFAPNSPCTPNRVLTQVQEEFERTAFADPIGYSLVKAVQKALKV
jgi:hypothetical protein